MQCLIFNIPSTPEISPISQHDALPISISLSHLALIELAHAHQRKKAGVPPLAISEYSRADRLFRAAQEIGETLAVDRKSTRLNSSHTVISYAVFCLKK